MFKLKKKLLVICAFFVFISLVIFLYKKYPKIFKSDFSKMNGNIEYLSKGAFGCVVTGSLPCDDFDPDIYQQKIVTKILTTSNYDDEVSNLKFIQKLDPENEFTPKIIHTCGIISNDHVDEYKKAAPSCTFNCKDGNCGQIVVEYGGIPLTNMNKKSLSFKNFITFFKKYAIGCKKLIDRNIIHNDIKYDNALYVLDTDNDVKTNIIDFGLALSTTSYARKMLEYARVNKFGDPSKFNVSIDQFLFCLIYNNDILGGSKLIQMYTNLLDTSLPKDLREQLKSDYEMFKNKVIRYGGIEKYLMDNKKILAEASDVFLFGKNLRTMLIYLNKHEIFEDNLLKYAEKTNRLLQIAKGCMELEPTKRFSFSDLVDELDHCLKM